MKENTMKKSLLALSVSGLMLSSGFSVHAAGKGDLDIFAPEQDTGDPTILFMIETSSFMWTKDADLKWDPGSWIKGTVSEQNNDVNEDKYYQPYGDKVTYKRWGYSTWTYGNKYNRMTRLKDMIFYLMNTKDALPKNIKIGVGRYQATPTGSRTETKTDTPASSSNSGGIFVPVDYIDGNPEQCKNKDWTVAANKCGMYSQQRRRIKEYVASLCFNQASCIGETPMAWAYAEAGAYMMNTKTAPIVADEVNNDGLTDGSLIYTLQSIRLRGRYKTTKTPALVDGLLNTEWQFCPEDKQVLVDYNTDAAPLNHNYRLDCKEEDWLPIDRYNYTNFKIGGHTLQWNCGLLGWCASTNRPHGIVGNHQGKFQFTRDTSVSTLRGLKWDYFEDALRKPNISIPSRAAISGPFRGSGVRNAPLEVRDDKSYKYDDPEISECSGKVITGNNPSDPNNEKEVGSKNGIIFFTSGFNRSATTDAPVLAGTTAYTKYNASADTAENVMNMSLSPFESNVIATAPHAAIDCDAKGTLDGRFVALSNPTQNKWHCIGHYAKRLNSKDNRLGRKIKTGVVLFGSTNEEFEVEKTVNGIPKYNCNSKDIPLTVMNACKLGSKEYGDGGFIRTTQKTQDAANQQLSNLLHEYKVAEDSQIKATPIGGPVIPTNPFRANALLKSAYLPLVYPDMTGTKAQWQGNLRKYQVTSGGLVDKQTPPKSPFADAVGKILADTTLDFWAATARTVAYKSGDQAGGVFDKRPYPDSADSTKIRPVFLDYNISDGDSLKKLSDDSANLANMVNNISISNINDASNKANQNDFRRRLLNFIGYDIPKFVSQTDDAASNPNTTHEKIIAYAKPATEVNRTYGAVIHSKPLMVSYKATQQTDGTVKDTKSYVIFGAADNALHIVDEATGVEKMAFIPQETLAGEGYKALSTDGTMQNAPNYGVDAPWTANVRYKLKKDNDVITLEADKLNIYGGLGLGGKRFYGLNILDIANPKLLFSKEPSINKFTRMGHIWSKPLLAKLKWGYQKKDVVIFSGGYDKTYDLTDDDRIATVAGGTKKIYEQENEGNAVYIVDAETGNPLITIGNVGKEKYADTPATEIENRGYFRKNKHIKYSIVGTPKVLDRDADGLIDHIYFADMAGQVFRADLDNKDRSKNNAMVKQVIRIADFTSAHGAGQPGPRFYETPAVTIHKEGNKRFAVVSVASGDRSHPKFKNSMNNTDKGFNGFTNRVYAVIDKDVARKDLFSDGVDYDALHTKDITLSKMKTNTAAADTTLLLSTKVNATTAQRLDGWYYPINRFDGVDANGNVTKDAKHLKAYGPMAAIDNELYVGVYNFYDSESEQINKCAATVKGKTEANVYCLPYGFCTEGGTNKGALQRFFVGRGISDITFFGGDSLGLDKAVFTQSSGNSSATTELETQGISLTGNRSPAYYLKPTRWYDMSLKKEPAPASTTTTNSN